MKYISMLLYLKQVYKESSKFGIPMTNTDLIHCVVCFVICLHPYIICMCQTV